MSKDKKFEVLKGVKIMNATIERDGYKRLNFDKLIFSDDIISSKEALCDIEPIQWSDVVLNGCEKVIIKKTNEL